MHALVQRMTTVVADGGRGGAANLRFYGTMAGRQGGGERRWRCARWHRSDGPSVRDVDGCALRSCLRATSVHRRRPVRGWPGVVLLTVSAIAGFQWPRCGARKPQPTKHKLMLSAKFGLQWIQFGDYYLVYSGYSLVFNCWVTVDTVSCLFGLLVGYSGYSSVLLCWVTVDTV